MIVEVTMPVMGADMTEGTVVKWLKAEGDEVKRGDDERPPQGASTKPGRSGTARAGIRIGWGRKRGRPPAPNADSIPEG